LKISLLRSWDPNIRELVAGASVALAARLGGAAARLGVNVAVAWLLSAGDVGIFLLAMTVVTVASMIGRLGLDNTVLRFSAASADAGDWDAVAGVWRRGMVLAVGGSAAVAAGLILGARWLSAVAFEEPALGPALAIMSLAIVPISIFMIYGQLLKGIKRIGEGVIVLTGLLPVFSVVLILLLVPRWSLNGAVAAYVVAAIATATIGALLWRRAVEVRRGGFPLGDLLRSALPLFVHTCLQMVVQHGALIMLGIWAASEEVGVFGLAYRTAFLVTYVLIAVNAIAAPKFAAMYHRGDLQTLKRTAQGSTLLMCLAAGPVLAVFLLFPRQVMHIYSAEFSVGGPLLAILAAGQFINVATGSVQQLLMMSGRERWMMRTTAVAAALALALNWALIPRWGAMGAAAATAVVWAVQNVMVLVVVRRQLGFWVVPAPGAWRSIRSDATDDGSR
jgi:O-antigen/teichoic acid export membrane protein